MSVSCNVAVAVDNLERMLYFMSSQSSALVHSWMTAFEQDPRTGIRLERTLVNRIQQLFVCTSVSDAVTAEVMREAHRGCPQRLLCPHSAVGVAACMEYCCREHGDEDGSRVPMVCVLTANANKFPETVLAATGVLPPTHPIIERLKQAPHRFKCLPKQEDGDYVQQWLHTLKRDIQGGSGPVM